MHLTPQSGAASPTDLIPAGFLCWVMVTFREMKHSQSGGRYADLEYVIAENQPLARKKLWEMIGDPDFDGNSEAYRNMGMVSLTRMVESCGIVDVNDPASYEKLNGLSIEQIMSMLDGKYVAVKIKIEKGGDGYADKNKVGDYLSPNAQSSSFKSFTKLTAGDHGITVNPAAATASKGFGGQSRTAAAPAARTGFGTQPVAHPAPQAQTPAPSTSARPAFDPNKAPAFLGNR